MAHFQRKCCYDLLRFPHKILISLQVLRTLMKFPISCGRNVLLQGNSWRLRFDGLSLRFWQKTNSFATLTRVFFSQTSTRVHQILIPTHNHEVTPYTQMRLQELYLVCLSLFWSDNMIVQTPEIYDLHLINHTLTVLAP